jgi:hypothetical protein
MSENNIVTVPEGRSSTRSSHNITGTKTIARVREFAARRSYADHVHAGFTVA